MLRVVWLALLSSATMASAQVPVGFNELNAITDYLLKKKWNFGVIPDGSTTKGTFIEVKRPIGTSDRCRLSPEDYTFFAKTKSVRLLDLRDVYATDATLAALAAMPSLTELIIYGPEITDRGMKAFANFKSLQSLTITCDKVTDVGLRELAQVPNLRTLHMERSRCTGTGFLAFAECDKLLTLELPNNRLLNDEGLKATLKIPKLTGLLFNSDTPETRVTPRGLQTVIDTRFFYALRFPTYLMDDGVLKPLIAKNWLHHYQGRVLGNGPEHLTQFEFPGCKLTDEGFDQLQIFIGLESLNIDGAKITDAAIPKLATFPKLTSLNLSRTKGVSAVGLATIPPLRLTKLSLEECPLPEPVFNVIEKMPTIETLSLSKAQLRGASLKHLLPLVKLTELNLQGTACDDIGAGHIVGLPALRVLRLQNTQITDAGLKKIAMMQQLRVLELDGTRVTRAAFLQAAKEHPSIKMTYAGY